MGIAALGKFCYAYYMKFWWIVLAAGVNFSASATTWSQSQSIFVRYHFSGFAYSKQVREVYVHAGVQRYPSHCMSGQSAYWDRVRHIKMESMNGHFFAKAQFAEYTGECQAAIGGPVVQYWVYFTDGTSLVTEVVQIPTTLTPAESSSQFKAYCQKQSDDFKNWQDSDRTVANGYLFDVAD